MFATRLSALLLSVVVGGTALIFNGCATLPDEIDDSPLLTTTEILLQARVRVLDTACATYRFSPANSAVLGEYFESIAMRMYPNDNLGRVTIWFMREKVLSLNRVGYEFPGMRILLDTSFFSKLGGENEIAALIAFVHERARLGSYRDRLAWEINEPVVDYRMITGYFTDEEVTATAAAADALYAAGYDPRGLYGFLDRFPETSDGKMKLLKETAERTIFKHPPLVNPVVRTPRFYTFQREFAKH